MKNLFLVLTATICLLSACSKETPPPPKQEVITQQEQPRTASTMLAEAKDKLAEAKDKLTQENKYGCCLKEPCNFCALNMGECDCYKDLKKGEHVCVECYAGWQQGKGGIEGIKKQDVKTSFTEHEHEE